MLSVYKVEEKTLRQMPNDTADRCWVNLVAPTHNELHRISAQYNIDIEMLTAALDPDERARFETWEGTLLIIVRVPITNEEEEPEPNDIPYITRPLGIILAKEVIITVCTKESTVISDFAEGKVRGFDPANRINFILQVFYRTSLKYQRFLREIDLQTNEIEKDLQQTLQNDDLIRLMSQEKSLVFFATSLRGNHGMMERLRRTSFFKLLSDDDQDLLEEVLIDNLQAIEMTATYTNILSGLMDVFASIVNNNLNAVMKRLTQITIILMIPTLIFSAYGMNVGLPFQQSEFAFVWVILICLVSVAAGVMLFRLNRKA